MDRGGRVSLKEFPFVIGRDSHCHLHLASGLGLPVSTTYVAFAAVLGSGLSDRVFARGNADTKLGRAIWVVTCWFLAPIIAIVTTGCVAWIVYHLSTADLVACIAMNLAMRHVFKRRADVHEQRFHFSDSAQSTATLEDQT